MPNYIVTVQQSLFQKGTIEIEAESPEEAREIARKTKRYDVQWQHLICTPGHYDVGDIIQDIKEIP